jgi:hypothetical protein
MTSSTFLVYLDACCYSYVSKENTPFLHKISQGGFFGRVETVPGFTQEAAMMTGKYPNETGHFTWYRYSPEKSPYAWTRPFGFLSFLRRYRIYYPVKVGIRLIADLVTSKEYQDPAFIPLSVLHLFENLTSALPEHLPNLRSLCRVSKKTCFERTKVYDLIGSRGCREMLYPILESIKNRDFYDLYLIHLGELDGVGHKYGPHPELFRGQLLEIDSWLFRLFQSVKKAGLHCNLVITSDHGMADVKGVLDIETRLKETPLRIPKDYIYFLDSTMARFWFNNSEGRHVIKQTLSRIPHGHILSESEKDRLHINMGHDAYGELLFWADKGYLIFPNFFQSIASEKTKGMHGYMEDKDGVLIVYSDQTNVDKIIKKKDVVPLTEVFEITKALAEL